MSLQTSFAPLSKPGTNMPPSVTSSLIAHRTWLADERAGALKPNEISFTKKGQVRWRASEEESRSYTAEEIEAEHCQLHLVNERLKAFARSSRLHDIIMANMDADREGELS